MWCGAGGNWKHPHNYRLMLGSWGLFTCVNDYELHLTIFCCFCVGMAHSSKRCAFLSQIQDESEHGMIKERKLSATHIILWWQKLIVIHVCTSFVRISTVLLRILLPHTVTALTHSTYTLQTHIKLVKWFCETECVTFLANAIHQHNVRTSICRHSHLSQ